MSWQVQAQALSDFFAVGPRRTVALACTFAAATGFAVYDGPLALLAVLVLAAAIVFVLCGRPVLAGLVVLAALTACANTSCRRPLCFAGDSTRVSGVACVQIDRVLADAPGKYGAVARVIAETSQRREAVLPLPPGSLVYLSCACGGDGRRMRRPRSGQTVLARGMLVRPEPAVYPWEFDERRYLESKNVQAILHASSLVLVRAQPASRQGLFADFYGRLEKRLASVQELAARTRARMVGCHEGTLGHEMGRLLASMVIGERAVRAPASVVKLFQDLGLSHVLAASGFNLSIVTGLAYFCVRLLTPNRWILMLAGFLAMLSFLALAGLSPSIERAALVGSLLLLSRCQARSLHAPAALALALVLTLCVNPAMLTDVGLQLSYLATAALIAFCPLLDPFCQRLKRKIWRLLAGAAAAVMVAQLSVLPLQMLYFWRVSLLFLPANLLVAPAVLACTAGGFSSSLFLCLGQPNCDWLAGCIDHVLRLPLAYIMWVTRMLAALGPSVLPVGPPPAASMIAYYTSAMALWCSLVCRRRRRLFIIWACLAVTALFWRPPRPHLVVACFKQALVIIDAEGHCTVQGQERSLIVDRFLRYQAVAKAASELVVPAPVLVLSAPLPAQLSRAEQVDCKLAVVRVASASELVARADLDHAAELLAASHAPLVVLSNLGRRAQKHLQECLRGQPVVVIGQTGPRSLVLIQPAAGAAFAVLKGRQRGDPTVTSVSSSTR